MGKKVKKEVEPPPKDVFDPLLIESKTAATVVLMLSSPEEEVLAKACDALYKFASKGDENKVTLLGLGAVEHLYKLISHEDPIVRRNAIMVFGIMASNDDVKKLLRELDVTNSLISQLAPEEDVVIHEFATLCLAHMAVEHTTKLHIFKQGGLEPLIRLLGSPDPDVQKNSVECIYLLVQEFSDLHVEALAVLGNCLEDVHALQLLQQTGGLKKLLSFVGVSAVPDIQKNAAKAIAKAAYDSEIRKILNEEEVEKTLINLLKIDNDGVKVAASQAISAMCENSASKRAFGLQGIPQLVQLLNSDSEKVKEAAVTALANLTAASPGNASAVAEAEGIKPLVNTLNAQRDQAVANAATALTNLATQELFRITIQGCGVMSALAEPLRSTNSQVQSKAAFAVAAFGCDADARTELRNAGGLRPLVELLHSKNAEVRRNACLAVTVCASDEVTAVELCRLGVLAAEEKAQDSSYEQTPLSPALSRKSSREKTRFVANKMGGSIERDKLDDFNWELHISEIEFELKCNVVPIGKVKKGTFYHRALLFKVVADRIGIGCSLVRGEYNRAWNEVELVDDSPQGIAGLLLPPQEYIVDLMFEPGFLMKQGSAEADQYKHI
ncbi:Armc3 [Columba guinea]|nr:Armc3 [Columba guinea]